MKKDLLRSRGTKKKRNEKGTSFFFNEEKVTFFFFLNACFDREVRQTCEERGNAGGKKDKETEINVKVK